MFTLVGIIVVSVLLFTVHRKVRVRFTLYSLLEPVQFDSRVPELKEKTFTLMINMNGLSSQS